MATPVLMPQLTDTMIEGYVSYWIKNEGEEVSIDEPLVTVETDKATVEVLANTSGILRKILVPEGEMAKVDQVIAIIGQADEDIEPLLAGLPSRTDAPEPPLQQEVHESSDKPIASPAARRLAKEKGINLTDVPGSGENGLITAGDVEQYTGRSEIGQAAESPIAEARSGSGRKSVAPALEAPENGLLPITGVRQAMFDSMTASAGVPQVTTVAKADLTDLLAYSKKSSISITSFVVSAVSKALTAFPLLNSSIEGKNIILKKSQNIGVAVSTPKGLVVPVIKDAQDKHVVRLSKEIADLARKGRENRLSLDEISGGSFTVTNSGVFGSLFFTPRVNPPEMAVLGIGKVSQEPVVIDQGIHVRAMMHLCLSYDHRVIDGETAVTFVQEIRKHLESPVEQQVA